MIGQLLDARELAEARAKLYRLLSSVYIKPPDPDFLKFLAEWVASVSGAEAPFQLLSCQMRRGLKMLNSYFKRVGESSWQELGEAASVEFTRLFRGVKRHYSPLPPYESLYREDSGRVFGELTGAVRREYRRFGLELADGLGGEPPDHIGFQLDFMHFLCRQEAEAWGSANRDEALRFLLAGQEFLREHLVTWLPGFCDEVREHDRLGLFGALADLTEGWVIFDYKQPHPGEVAYLTIQV